MDHHVLCLFAILATIGRISGSEWTYSGDNGPDHWKDHFSTCGGKRQSPINILTANAMYKEFSVFKNQGYDSTKGVSMKLHNNGHTAQIDITGDLKLEGAGLDGAYKTLQMHFHWGSKDEQGSEHTINGKQYPMEMHIVNYKESYGNVSNALNRGDGLAVLGFFFELSDENNKNFDTIINKLADIKDAANSVDIDAVSLIKMLPSNRQNFWRYEGSLTTPTCTESVIWTVFASTIQMSGEQLGKFRELFSEEAAQHGHKLLADNFRPVQALNDRKVYSSFMSNGFRPTAYLPFVFLPFLTRLS